MKRNISFLILASALLCLTAPSGWARLPKPIQASGVFLCIDLETQTLCFKSDASGKKPFVIDWNKDTEFVIDGKVIGPSDLKTGVQVAIVFKELSFRNPLLKRVAVKSATRPVKTG